ncbi:hypothetical protein [Paenibacillus sp. FSL L8-0463]|uniref:hypothetical protein n=1 Tax=Paenibacillus sp. FSL L8-0463 TaxID=2954687 RepID=UPI003119D0A2
MRLSRSSRNRNIRRYTLPQIAGIVVISAYGIGQITTPTYALLTDVAATESSNITTAFVFPSTVDHIANQASEAMKLAAWQREAAREALAEITDKNTDSETAEGRIGGIQEAAAQTREAAAGAAALLAELQGYLTRSQLELEQQVNEVNQRLSPYEVDFNQLTTAQNNAIPVFEQLLSQANLTLGEFQEMVRKLSSIRRVDAYVQAAYHQASTAAEQARSYADETSLMHTEAADVIQGLKEAEKKAKLEAEEKAKLEAGKKAKLEAEEKAKLEAEKKAKLEAEEKAKLESEKKAKLEAEEKAKLEAEEKAKLEAEEKAKLEAEEQAKPDKAAEPEAPVPDANPDSITVKTGEKQDVF